ncbi:DUF2120 domain-containing protein [Methanobacterium sp. CWC-01]|uniref:DUF2120 domain-containing protein n=1 Tax=Methanobacterium aridiramus TaxID=2584467 RepID=UPI002577FF54|nr:DUF2120 domain-containing protein [Methanobacterium sp. CWC-01]WJI09727.1 DUF2120 domain-containing protein [Methanobacterium sp. CWC-01]
MRTHNIAGLIMGGLEAFEGSRAAMDTSQMLIVRGMSRKRVQPDELGSTLDQLLKDLGVKEMNLYSDEAGDILGVMDEQIRSSVPINTETDIGGIYRLKESFESMNCHTDYRMGLMEGDIAIFVVIWKDKSGIGPLFVEVVISLLEA